jgi:hypothetical protein
MTRLTNERDRAKHCAFAAAIEELYLKYPLPPCKYQKTYWRRVHDRNAAVRNALSGSPLYMIDCFTHKVPAQELKAVYALIYG